MMHSQPDDRPHVDPLTTRIGLRRSWDAALERTARLRPSRCHAALVDWHPERWPDSGGMPVEIAFALSSALTKLGTVIGRIDDQGLAGPCTTLIPPPRRSLLAVLRDGMLRRAPAEVLAQTRDLAEVAAMLDAGWSVQSQAILVLSPNGPLDTAIDALRYRSDWRDFQLEPPLKALVVPSIDGDGAMFATPSATALADVLDQVELAVEAAGFRVVQM